MAYAVKEIYYTLQGEGAQAGRPAVFLRFAGCNLWSGREADRATAVCRFCDTDFVGTDGPGGGSFRSAAALAGAVSAAWRGAEQEGRRYVVCTGGEPLLQLDEALVEALHSAGFEIGVETNGTLRPPAGIDWLCVSPKAGAEPVVAQADELKLVYHQPGAEPERFAGFRARFRFLQPMDGPDLARHQEAAIEYCLAHPEWRLSVQTHKMLGID
ncbi:MAG: 7-carboxy-7-deazaguanine synthase [Gemmatimonadales bacterium]